jgi:uncharacterized protein (TIGR02246 family)
MISEPARLRDFAARYTAAWCSQNAPSVAACYAQDGSLTVNGGTPAVGRKAITELAQGFMSSFPDLRVLLDDILIKGDRPEIPLDTDRHQHWAGRDRTPSSHQPLRSVEDRRRRAHCRVAGPFR